MNRVLTSSTAHLVLPLGPKQTTVDAYLKRVVQENRTHPALTTRKTPTTDGRQNGVTQKPCGCIPLEVASKFGVVSTHEDDARPIGVMHTQPQKDYACQNTPGWRRRPMAAIRPNFPSL